eukprot:TRINITY_DN12831_c1_g1_i1.p1 TRINITY_DN12831_c1_g1~~TRINITY_DN12831_c1_g1_i1.p1  ORF type:complete len:356 (-),score=28.76 TRINITY_DN12831_c1_g1_i1:501-1568(-)
MGTELEKDAYYKLFRAFACRNHSDWKHQQLLKTVRTELGLSGDFHDEVFDSVMNDGEVQQLSWALNQNDNQVKQQLGHSCFISEGYEQQIQQLSPSGLGMGALARYPPPPITQIHKQNTIWEFPNRNRVKYSPENHLQRLQEKSEQNIEEIQVAQQNFVLGDVHPLIGRKVRRWWPANNETGDVEDWYTGVFADYKQETGDFCIIYDYGKQTETLEWFNLQTADSVEYEILDEVFLPGIPEQQSTQLQFKQPPKKRKQAHSVGASHSSDEDDEFEQYRKRVCAMNYPELKFEEEQVQQQQQLLQLEIDALKYAMKLQTQCHDVDALRNEELRLQRESDKIQSEIRQLQCKLNIER